MERVGRRGLLVAVAAALGGCAGLGGTGGGADADNPAAGDATQMGDLDLTSPAFEDGGRIPQKYGKAYANVNPPLVVDGVPDGAATLALVVDDPDAPGGTFTHWLVWNIPPDIGEIPEGWDPPAGVVQGENGFGGVGYGGPKPPSEHTYRFKLYALDTSLSVSRGAGTAALGQAMDGHVRARTQLAGTFTP